jgi:predicted glycogen debranching enzyme
MSTSTAGVKNRSAAELSPVRRLVNPTADGARALANEWLVTNGLGGYASGTLSGILTRRYHGLLVAALPAPIGRMVMLSHVDAQLRLPSGAVIPFDPEPRPLDTNTLVADEKPMTLVEFRLELGLPIWRFEGSGFAIEKRVLMPHRQNTVHVSYRVVEATSPVRLELRPFMHVRHYESPLTDLVSKAYVITAADRRFEVVPGSDLPNLRMLFYGGESQLTLDALDLSNRYIEEQSRGYEHEGTLWSPGYFHLDVEHDVPDGDATIVASTEGWETIEALSPASATQTEIARRSTLLSQAPEAMRSGVRAELVLAADQFLVSPAARPEETTRAAALGLEARTVIAGYHWFTDWGRDTMISLEGLTLATGRAQEAALILKTFAGYVRDGLIPNMFPDGERQGLYHTADATLWFFHAVGRYVDATNDRETLHHLLPVLRDIIDHHMRGTRFGIRVDPDDWLLREGEEGYQLTWMDAKVGDWVVTPRRGKAVEINALFYNALRLLENWIRAEEGDRAAQRLADCADRMRGSFNRRFWYEAGGYLYDVVDGEAGDDPSCRPNQVLAISLTHPVLDESHWESVLEVVRHRLLSPYGLRTLAPGHPDYSPKYYGDLRARDAAYHQGTIWPWLIGPYIDAWLRVYPGQIDAATRILGAFPHHLSEAGIGSVSEIFDAEPPYTPRGCISQAWSVAELLRALSRLP